MAQIEPVNLSGLACRFVDIEHGATDSNLATGMLRSSGSNRGKARNHIGLIHTDNSRIASGHPEVRQVSSAAWQDPLDRKSVV